jgi:hypothetical protein
MISKKAGVSRWYGGMDSSTLVMVKNQVTEPSPHTTPPAFPVALPEAVA